MYVLFELTLYTYVVPFNLFVHHGTTAYNPENSKETVEDQQTNIICMPWIIFK